MPTVNAMAQQLATSAVGGVRHFDAAKKAQLIAHGESVVLPGIQYVKNLVNNDPLVKKAFGIFQALSLLDCSRIGGKNFTPLQVEEFLDRVRYRFCDSVSCFNLSSFINIYSADYCLNK